MTFLILAAVWMHKESVITERLGLCFRDERCRVLWEGE